MKVSANEGRWSTYVFTKKIVLTLENWVDYEKGGDGNILKESMKRWSELLVNFRITKGIRFRFTIRSSGYFRRDEIVMTWIPVYENMSFILEGAEKAWRVDWLYFMFLVRKV